MKKVLLLAALTMVAASAHASKARLAALQNAAHLVDVQNDFDQPWQVGVQGELATVEFGTAGATTNAEGGFVRAMGDGYLGAYLGHQPTALTAVNSAITNLGLNAGASAGFSGGGAPGTAVTAGNAFGVSNPLNIMYAAKMGDVNWGANLYWENSTQTVDSTGSFSDRHSNMSGISLGASNGTWDVDAIIGLIGKGTFTAADANAKMGTVAVGAGSVEKFEANTTATLRGGWKMDSMYYYAMYNMAGGKFSNDTSTAASEVKINNWTLGAINSHKRDGVDFFYGASLTGGTVKNSDTAGGTENKVDTFDIPLIVGVEAEANSWMVLRGSITQSLIGSNKFTYGATSTGMNTTATNDTTIGAGAAFKFNKFTLDTFIYAAANGNVSLASDGTGVTNTTSNTTNGTGDKFLTQASLTYAF